MEKQEFVQAYSELSKRDEFTQQLYYQGWLLHALSGLFSVRPDGWDQAKYNKWFGKLKTLPVTALFEKYGEKIFFGRNDDNFFRRGNEAMTASGSFVDEVWPYLPTEDQLREIFTEVHRDTKFWRKVTYGVHLPLNENYETRRIITYGFSLQEWFANWLVTMVFKNLNFIGLGEEKRNYWSEPAIIIPFAQVLYYLFIPSEAISSLRSQGGDGFWIAYSEAHPDIINLFKQHNSSCRNLVVEKASAEYDKSSLFNARCTTDQIIELINNKESGYKKPGKEILALLKGNPGKSIYEVFTEKYGSDTLLVDLRYKKKKWDILPLQLNTEAKFYLVRGWNREDLEFPIKNSYVSRFPAADAIQKAKESGDSEQIDASVLDLALWIDEDVMFQSKYEKMLNRVSNYDEGYDEFERQFFHLFKAKDERAEADVQAEDLREASYNSEHRYCATIA